MNSGTASDGCFELSPDLVRVWRVRLDQSFPELAAAGKLLSPEEIARASRFHFESDRRRYTIARGALRLILGRCLRSPPERITFSVNPFGKPSLVQSDSVLQFNVSHSHEIILIAIAARREIGVDVEYIRPVSDRDRLVATNFSASEKSTWQRLAPDQREEAFFTAWTRKEAYLKARGAGLSVPLASFSVSLNPDDPAAIVEVNGDMTAAAHWGMTDVPVGPGYAAALVAAGTEWRLDCVDWIAGR